MSVPHKMIWLDLETTGLDPNKHDIVEVFAASTPFRLHGSHFSATHFSLSERVHAVIRRREWDMLEDGVVAMHARSGLLDESRRSVTLPSEVEAALLAAFPFDPGDDRYVLAGNSVHFDLGFLRRHMSAFAARLSHRVFDVSAIRLLCLSLGMPHVKGDPAHRAEADVFASIELAGECVRWLAHNFGPAPDVLQELTKLRRKEERWNKIIRRSIESEKKRRIQR